MKGTRIVKSNHHDLKQGEAGLATTGVVSQHGITEQTYYQLKAKYGGMDSRRSQETEAAGGGEPEAEACGGGLTLDNRALKRCAFKKLVSLRDLGQAAPLRDGSSTR